MSQQEKHSKQLGEAKTAAGQGKRGRKRKGMCLEDRPLQEANAAGIDIGAREIYVAVPPDRDAHPVRVFSTFTEDLETMAKWLVSFGPGSSPRMRFPFPFRQVPEGSIWWGT